MPNRTKFTEQFHPEIICTQVPNKGDVHCFCCSLYLDIDFTNAGIFMESS